jgi:hypothetical protein
MSDDSQIIVPASFIALFVPPGRIKPTEPREHIAARHDFCEDLATMLVDTAQTKLWELGLAEDEVLRRTWHGLGTGGLALSAAEARWVITRLAELLGWSALPFDDADADG